MPERSRSVTFERWGDPKGGTSYANHPFGAEVVSFRRYAGMTVPVAGLVGWHPGSHLWQQGAFFRYDIEELSLRN